MRSFLLVDQDNRPSLRCEVFQAGLLVLLLTGLALFPSCSTPKVQSQVVKAEGVPVTVATVIQKTVPIELQAIGNVEAYSTVSVKSQVEGQLERAYFQEGQDVKKGDLLFTIDPRPFEAALRQAEANLARDTAQAQHARSDAERYLKLSQAGIASKEQYDQAQTTAEALDASVRADKAAAENAKIQLGYCAIRSPIDARTGTLIVHQGNVVKANDLALVVINQMDPIYVSFSVPEKYLSEIKRHMASGKLRVNAIVPGEERRPAPGVLTFVNNTVDSTTGTIRLKGTFVNPEKRLWPGQFVNLKLTITALPNAVVVPSQAVETGQQGRYVFVVKPDLTVDFRVVTAGDTVEGDTVIANGLKPGERVVTDGQLRLFPSAKVEIKKQ